MFCTIIKKMAYYLSLRHCFIAKQINSRDLYQNQSYWSACKSLKQLSKFTFIALCLHISRDVKRSAKGIPFSTSTGKERGGGMKSLLALVCREDVTRRQNSEWNRTSARLGFTIDEWFIMRFRWQGIQLEGQMLSSSYNWLCQSRYWVACVH